MDDIKKETEKSSNYLNSNLSKVSTFLNVKIILLCLTQVLLAHTDLIINKKMDIVNNIIAPLIVGLLIAGFGWLWALRKVKQNIDAAPKRYVQELDNLITRALKEGEENAILNSRAIVSTRNSLRASLVSLSKHLNSEIDRLAKDIGETVETPLEPSRAENISNNLEAKRAYDTIQVLARIWPAKKIQIEYEIRKLLTELGLS